MSGKKRFFGIAALAAWAVLALSCGGGGGGGGTGTGPDYSPGDVVLESAASDPSEAILRVVVYGPLSDVYGIAFHLSYDESILAFASASKTTVIEDVSCGGGCILFLTDDSPSNVLIVGMNRTGAVGGVALPDGPNVFMTLQFTAVATGSSELSFVPGTNKVCDPTTPDCVDLSDTWYGGTVSVEI
jgi:hypothetical protein